MPADHKLGDFVVLAQRPDWGVGQVQSVIGNRVTVNFEHAGKRMVNTDQAGLQAAPAGTGEPASGPGAA